MKKKLSAKDLKLVSGGDCIGIGKAKILAEADKLLNDNNASQEIMDQYQEMIAHNTKIHSPTEVLTWVKKQLNIE